MLLLSRYALQRAVFMPLGCSVPVETQKSRHAGACRLTACDPRRLDLRGLGIGSGFVRFRLFIWFIVRYRFSVIVWRCFCNRLGHLGGFGFFQRAGDDVD